MFQIQWVWHNIGKQKKQYVFALILSLIFPAMSVINPRITQAIIDNVVVGVTNSAGETVKRPEMLIPLVVAMCIITLVRTVIGYTMIILCNNVSQWTIQNIREKIYDNLQANDMDFYDHNRTGDLMTRLTGDMDMVRFSIADIFRMLINAFVVFTVGIVYFFSTDWLFTLILLAITPFILVATVFYSKKVKPLYVGLREKLTQLNTAAQENISGNKGIKAFAREDYEISKFDEKNKAYRDGNVFVNLYWLKFSPYLEMAANSMTIITAVVGGLFIINGRLTAGELMGLSGFTWALADPVRTLGMHLNDLQRFFASANKVIEVYYQAPAIQSKDNAYSSEKMDADIEFKDVTFRFGKHTVLDHVSFHLKKGETLAIMGATGCGKTTIANLILRFYDVQEGAVLVDGVNVKDWDLHALRKHIGMATQDVFLFSDTAEGNVCYGEPEMSEEEVHRFAKIADADEFIKKMTEGYDTIIGERGVGLSGGQKQRIALARALAIRPSLLILDDTTSAVDMETEKYIQGQLDQLDFDCTRIIIAQRISSVRKADQIIVLDNAKIAEMGTHEQLLQNNGYYSEVYKIQNSGMDLQPVAQG